MSVVTRVAAEIDLRDDLSGPLKKAEAGVQKFADNAQADLARTAAAARKSWAEFGQGLEDLSQRATAAGLAFSVALTAPILLAARSSIKAAMSLEESMSKTRLIFNEAADSVVAFAETADTSLGLSRGAALDAVAAFGGLMLASGKTAHEAAALGKGMTRLAVDLASVNDVPIADAIDKLRAGLIGEAEPLRRFRIMLSETATSAMALDMGLAATSEELTAGAKILARHALIMNQTSLEQGDFARTAQSAANQTKILQAEVGNLSAGLGEMLLPYYKDLLTIIRSVTEHLAAMGPETRRTLVTFAAIAAAIGPVLLGLGAIGNAITGAVAAKAEFAKLGASFAAVGGAAGVLGKAVTAVKAGLVALTGPIAVIVAGLAALYLAWKTNLGGIRGVLTPFVQDITGMLADVWTNVKSTFGAIADTIIGTWHYVAVASKPVLDAWANALHLVLRGMGSAVRTAFRGMTDVINASLSLVHMLVGSSWDGISHTMRASLMRMKASVTEVWADINGLVLRGARMLQRIPGAAGILGPAVQVTEDEIARVRAAAVQYRGVASVFDAAAAAARAARARAVAEGARDLPGVPRDRARAGATARPGGGGGGMARPAAAAARAMARPAAAAIDEAARAQRALNDQVWQGARAYASQREQIEFTTERQRALWEVTRGRFREAHTWTKVLLVAEAALLDQERERLAIRARSHALAADIARTQWDADAAIRQSTRELENRARPVQQLTRLEEALHEVTYGAYADASAYEQERYLLAARRLDDVEAETQAAERMADSYRDAGSTIVGFIASTVAAFRQRQDQDAALREQARRLREQIKLEEKADQLRVMARGIEHLFMDTLDRLFTHGFRDFFSNVVSGFRDMVRDIMLELLQLQVRRALTGLMDRLLGLAVTAAAPQPGAPKSAAGGRVYPGTARVVGEIGPELFVPNVPGRIVPSYALAGAGGGHTTNITVNVATPNPTAFRRSETQIAAEVFARMDRRRRIDGRD